MTDTQKASNACLKFEFVHGLGQKIIGARLDAAFDVADFIEGGDHDDRNTAGARVGLEFLADLEATHARHHHIQKDEIRIFPIDGFERFDAIRR